MSNSERASAAIPPWRFCQVPMKEREAMEDEFRNYVRTCLPDIDRILANRQENPKIRPFGAAVFIVENLMTEIEGGDKEDYHEQQWFAILYRHVREWYGEFYKSNLDEPAGAVPGIVLVNGTPFLLRMSITRAEVEEEGVSSWMIFQVDSHPNEEFENWFESPPDFRLLKEDAQEELQNEVAEIVSVTRDANLNLMTVELDDESALLFRDSIFGHLKAAVEHIKKNSIDGRSLAVWELQMFLEKILKLLLFQRTGEYPNTHDLNRLRALADSDEGSESLTADFDNVPAWKVAANHRYCESDAVSTNAIFVLYKSSIRISQFYSRKMNRKYDLHGARFLARMPPWLGEARQMEKRTLQNSCRGDDLRSDI